MTNQSTALKEMVSMSCFLRKSTTAAFKWETTNKNSVPRYPIPSLPLILSERKEKSYRQNCRKISPLPHGWAGWAGCRSGCSTSSPRRWDQRKVTGHRRSGGLAALSHLYTGEERHSLVSRNTAPIVGKPDTGQNALNTKHWILYQKD